MRTIGYLHGEEAEVPLFGMEIEVEQATGAHNVGQWDITTDGSLREGGREFISPPLDLSSLVIEIAEFYKAYDALGFASNARTGIHVHADVRSYTMNQVTAILTSYVLTEPLLYNYCGEAREENIYCVPWYRAINEVELWNKVSREPLISAASTLSCEACKYSGLYLEPIRRLGTIEFRMAPTFGDALSTSRWLGMISKLVSFGAAHTAQRVLACYQQLGPEEYVREVFGEQLANVLLDSGSLDLLDYHGVEQLAIMLAGDASSRGVWRSATGTAATGSIGYRRSTGRESIGWFDPGTPPPQMDEEEEEYDEEEPY